MMAEIFTLEDVAGRLEKQMTWRVKGEFQHLKRDHIEKLLQ